MTGISERHRRILQLELAGYPIKRLAAIIGMTEAGVHIVRKSPMYQALLREERRQLGDAFRTGIVQRIVAAGPAAVDTLASLHTDPAMLGSTRVSAAGKLLDLNPEVAAAKAAAGPQQPTLTFDMQALARIASAVAEAEGRPALVLDHDPAPEALVPVRTLDDAVAAYDDSA